MHPPILSWRRLRSLLSALLRRCELCRLDVVEGRIEAVREAEDELATLLADVANFAVQKTGHAQLIRLPAQEIEEESLRRMSRVLDFEESVIEGLSVYKANAAQFRDDCLQRLDAYISYLKQLSKSTQELCDRIQAN